MFALETWQTLLLMKNSTLTKKDDIQAEAERIVIAAAKIIRAEIREREYDSKSYPTSEDIVDIDRSNKWVPRHLQTLLKTIVPS